MRKIIWYKSSMKLHDSEVPEKEKWIPVYGVGPWWAHLLYRWLEDLSSWLCDVVHDIQVKYIKPEDGDDNKIDIDGLDPMDGTAGYTDSK